MAEVAELDDHTQAWGIPLMGLMTPIDAIHALYNAQSVALDAGLSSLLTKVQQESSFANKASLPTEPEDNWPGRIAHTKDRDALWFWGGTAWKFIAAGKKGGVAVTPGSGVSIVRNDLYTRNGMLLGGLEWTRSAPLGHGDVILTLGAGFRPPYEQIVMLSAGPANSVIMGTVFNANGVVSTLSPPGGRVSGKFTFNVPLDMDA